MGADNCFALTALPVLDPPPASPPMRLADYLGRVPAGRPRSLVRCVLLADDLRQREAVLAGELPVPDPAVLTPAQVAGDAPLPDELAPSGERSAPTARLAADACWQSYFRYAAAIARDLRSPFLAEWVRWEATTRNALAGVRARTLGLDPESYQVARWLAEDSGEVDALVAAWSAAAHPLDAFRSLLASRWRWADRNEPWFTFDDDEFAAYAVKLELLHRWLRASELGPRRHAEGTGEAPAAAAVADAAGEAWE